MGPNVAKPSLLIASIIAGLLGAGCALDPAPAVPVPGADPSVQQPGPTNPNVLRSPGGVVYTPYTPASRPVEVPPTDTGEELNAIKTRELVYTVEVYDLLLPVGTISRNDEFWSRIDETAVDVGTYDMLYRNGIRLGVAPLRELDGLKAIAGDAQTRTYTVAGTEGKQIQIDMKLDVRDQSVFYYDASNALAGRTYEKSDNLIFLSFERTPRQPGAVRLSLMPTIRATQKKLIYALRPGREDRELTYVTPETPFRANLRTDVPVNYFLVIAPSPTAITPDLLGWSFFMAASDSVKQEHVLVIVPRAFEREGVASRSDK